MAKAALEKIDEQKRGRIFRNAAAEFARHGYHRANVNSIASRAGIAKGSIYLYFKDKRDLYHSTFLEAARVHNEIFHQVEELNLDPITRVEKVFEKSLSAFPKYRNMFKMYFDLTSAGNEKSLSSLAGILETHSAKFFRNVVIDGIASGSLREEISVEHAAYFIDSIYTLFFTSLASKYQQERFRIFTGAGISGNDALVRQHMRKILDMLETGIGTGRLRGRRANVNPRPAKGE